MHEHIIEQLKNLQSIKPDNGFVLRTRNLFIPTSASVTAPSRTFSIFNWQYASAFALVLLCSIVAIPFFVFTPEETLASLDTETLSSEIHSLPINVQLQELKYNETAQDTITSAVSEALNTDTNHLDQSLIMKEEKEINANTEVDTNVDDLINQALQ
ncbi:MAG: hypothetical protein WC727_03570 [Ignavibacteriaceae bacterium]|jgi:hypothetical protein